MLEREYLQNVRRELLARGIWGAHARNLIEQLGDHYRETVQTLRSEGAGEAAAQEKAVETMGAPATVANAAAEGLPGQSWLARHPWLAGISMFVALVVATPAVMAAGYYLSGLGEYMSTHDIHSLNYTVFSLFAFLTNWLPFLLGVSLLGWTAWKHPVGWKSLIIVSLAIGLATGTLSTQVTPPTHGYHSGNLTVACDSWIAAIGWLVSPSVRQSLKSDPLNPLGLPAGLLNIVALMKLLLPLAACLALRRTLRRFETT